MKLKTALLVILLLILNEKSNAQFGMGKPEEIKEVQSRMLVVVLKKENPEIVKKFGNKPDELKKYQKSIENYNEGFKSAMKLAWPYKNELRYIEISTDVWITSKFKPEIEKMLETNEKANYAFIMHTVENYSYQNGEFRDYTGMKLNSLAVGLSEKQGGVGVAKLPFINPSEADIVFGIQQIISYFDYRLNDKSRKEINAEISKNGLKLKEKTLLIDKGFMEEGLTAEKIKAVYPYPFKITDRTEMDSAIINKDDKFAYIQVVAITASTAGRRSRGETSAMKSAGMKPSSLGTSYTKSSLTFMQYLVNAQDGSLLGYAGGGVKMAGFSSGEHEIKKKHFESYLKLVKDAEKKN